MQDGQMLDFLREGLVAYPEYISKHQSADNLAGMPKRKNILFC